VLRSITNLGKLALAMATDKHHRIVESAKQARHAESGPSVLAMLVASTGLAIVILLALWFVFFRT
jgi:hypothetical protein